MTTIYSFIAKTIPIFTLLIKLFLTRLAKYHLFHNFFNLIFFNVVLLNRCIFWHPSGLLYLTENFFTGAVIQEVGISFFVFICFTSEFVETSETFGFPFPQQLSIHILYNFFCVVDM